MNSLTLVSPAKLNLFLKVLRRRADGYHELVTLFHRISLADRLTLRKAPGFSLKCSDLRLACGEENLITRTYRELQKEVPGLGGVGVFLHKKIPMGGGLGGGSGNAAAFLLGMKRLYRLKISTQRLVRIGARLGADVAFFVLNTSQAIGRGVGDILQPVPCRRKQYFVLALSSQGLATRTVYEALQTAKGGRPLFEKHANLTSVSSAIKMLCRLIDKGQLGQAAAFLRNDLESAAVRMRPEIGRVIRKMQAAGASAVAMSGSGPTVFAVENSLKNARRLAARMRKIDRSRKYVLCHTV